MISLKGEILLPKKLASFSGAKVNIYLEDVSLLDAPAKIVAQQVISDFNHEMENENRVEFVLQGETVNIRSRYSIRVHITFHNDGQIHHGDYISTQSYPVLTYGYPSHVLVSVAEVK